LNPVQRKAQALPKTGIDVQLFSDRKYQNKSIAILTDSIIFCSNKRNYFLHALEKQKPALPARC